MAENDSRETQSRSREDPCDQEIDEHESPARTKGSYMDFFRVFFTSKGAPQVLILSFLLSVGVGTTIGVVPDVLSDTYARIHHAYDGSSHCSDFDRSHKPPPCQQGADDAQAAVALFTFLQNILTLISNTTIGSVSDARGRRGIMILSMLLSILSPVVSATGYNFINAGPLCSRHFLYHATTLIFGCMNRFWS